MNRFATSTILVGGLVASMVGMAGAANADLSDTVWSQQQQHVTPTANGAINNTVPLAANSSGSATYMISQSDRDVTCTRFPGHRG